MLLIQIGKLGEAFLFIAHKTTWTYNISDHLSQGQSNFLVNFLFGLALLCDPATHLIKSKLQFIHSKLQLVSDVLSNTLLSVY